MIAGKKVEALQNTWQARAIEAFMEANKVTDEVASARSRAIAETLTLCSGELKAASKEAE